MADYARPEMLVPTQWVDEHKNDPGIAIVEVDVDTKAYDEGHIPGAQRAQSGRPVSQYSRFRR
jgi:thiosulfate/3-mercaptopyruvate sulfurtransferase